MKYQLIVHYKADSQYIEYVNSDPETHQKILAKCTTKKHVTSVTDQNLLPEQLIRNRLISLPEMQVNKNRKIF